MLRLELTDGATTVIGIEFRELTALHTKGGGALAPGTKLALAPTAQAGLALTLFTTLL
jgi:hypothetical protein